MISFWYFIFLTYSYFIETLITEPVATANASVQASIASPELKVTDEDENQPMATDETPVSTSSKSQTKAVSQTKERLVYFNA